MKEDPIVEEVRRIRKAYAEQFYYDLRAIFEDLKKKERKSGRVYIKGRARRLATQESK